MSTQSDFLQKEKKRRFVKLPQPIFLLVGSLAFLALSFLVLKTLYNSLLSAPGKNDAKKVFVIARGERVASIAGRLEKEGFIKNNLALKVYLKLNGLEKSLQEGDFKLTSSMSTAELVNALTHGSVDKWVTLVEGTRNEEMAEIFNQEFNILKEEFLSQAKIGYMFPDTYLIPRQASSSAVVKILRANFDKKFETSLQEKQTKSGLNQEEVIILASIVEREARDSEQRAMIAGILLKRLKIGMALEADATIQYALGYQENGKTWWKKTLTQEDLKVESTYNTRLHPGLPSGPICNPGLDAIKATLSPTESSYLYYIHDANGKAYYARTLDEHNENIAKYLR